MFAYSVTYGVYEGRRIIKTGTVGITHLERRVPEQLKFYLQEAMASMEPSYRVEVLNWKEITEKEYQRVFANNSITKAAL